jgi:hypothetical protein
MPGFTIPNAPDTDKSTLDQSEPDRVDFEILGNRRKGVVANAGVTSVSGNVVAVAAGTIAYEGTDYSLSANASYSLSAAPSSGNRFDLVVARYGSAAVTIQTVTGVASVTNPVFPVLLATDVVLAAVLRRTNESIVANDIIDKRAFVLSNTPIPSTLDSLTDVDVPSPSNDQVLQWNGTAWVNATITTTIDGGDANLVIAGQVYS